MRRLRQPHRTANSLLRLAIRQVFARPLLTGSLLLVLAPAGQTLTLGDINIRSALGQPLDARVPVRLGAGEALASTCVVPGHPASDLRGVPGANVTTPQATREGAYELQVTSPSALYEPIYELELRVQCPGAAVLIRQYVLMLDPPAAVANRAATGAEPALMPALAATAQPAAGGLENPASPRDVTRRLAAARDPGEPIETGARYRVVAGDSLSTIAARVKSRKVSLWALAGAIQAANPDAFIRNDANLIKLGSEILIPDATTAASPAGMARAAAQPLPSLAAAPVAAPEPAQAIPPVAASAPEVPVELAKATQPAATRAQIARPLSTSAPTTLRAAVPKPPAKVVDEAAADEPNPVVAAGAGILFGLCISALLWLRGRLPARRKSAVKSAPPRAAPETLATAVLVTAPAAAPLVTRSIEPAFSVSYTPATEDTLETDSAGEDITSELEDLFDSTDTTIQKRLEAEKTMAARSLGTESPNDYAPVVIAPGSPVDFLVGDPTDDQGTSQSATVDLHSLAASTTQDQQQAQTLLEALTLLERDYEEELTASQILDMSAVREALGNDLDEPTQIRDTHIRAASARQKAR